jgi:hypothetical protein
MAGTQAPKGFGILFALVGIPMILWSASGVSGELRSLDSPDRRQAQCLENISSLGLQAGTAQELCSCTVSEADKRGITSRYGAYDRDALGPIVDFCYRRLRAP